MPLAPLAAWANIPSYSYLGLLSEVKNQAPQWNGWWVIHEMQDCDLSQQSPPWEWSDCEWEIVSCRLNFAPRLLPGTTITRLAKHGEKQNATKTKPKIKGVLSFKYWIPVTVSEENILWDSVEPNGEVLSRAPFSVLSSRCFSFQPSVLANHANLCHII